MVVCCPGTDALELCPSADARERCVSPEGYLVVSDTGVPSLSRVVLAGRLGVGKPSGPRIGARQIVPLDMGDDGGLGTASNVACG